MNKTIVSVCMVGVMIFVLLVLGSCESEVKESKILPPVSPARSTPGEIETEEGREENGELPVCSRFEVAPASIRKGESAVITWQTEKADSGEVTIGDNSFPLSPIDSGSRGLTIDEEGSYTVSAVLHGAGGTGTCWAEVVVTGTAPVAEGGETESERGTSPDPSCTISVARPANMGGNLVKVSWTTSGAVKGSLVWESGVSRSGSGYISGTRVLEPNVGLPDGYEVYSTPDGIPASGFVKLNLVGESLADGTVKRGNCKAAIE